MKRLLMMTTALAATACLPPALDAGAVDSSGSEGSGAGSRGVDDGSPGSDPGDGATGIEPSDESTGTAPSDGTTGMEVDPPEEPVIEWSLELDPEEAIFRMARSPDGVVAVIQGPANAPYAEVVELSTGMELLWSRSLADAWIADLSPLGGGQYVVAGQTMDGAVLPSVWRLSCCGGFEHQSHPLGATGEPSGVLVAEPYEGGVFMVVGTGDPSSTFVQTPLDFAPATLLGTHGFGVVEGARTASGSILLRGSDQGAYLLHEVETDGTGSSTALEQQTLLVGSGDDLALMWFGNEEARIQRYGGDAVVEVPIPGLEHESIVADRRERFALAYRRQEADGGSTVRLVEFDEGGVVVRELALPRIIDEHAHSFPHAIAVGEDDAIYVALSEGGADGLQGAFLHRIASI